MYASDFRARARQSLKGKWGVSVAVGFVASLLMGGVWVSGGSGAAEDGSGYLSFVNQKVFLWVLTAFFISTLLALMIGGVIQLGWCKFNLNLINGKEARFGDLFSQFHRLGAGILMNLTLSLFIALWSLLLIIPGIIATYAYAMVPYLMAEFPELRVMDAIRESKRLMKGNKWRLFCLQFSFLGWAFLTVLTFGIGNLWLTPYMHAADAAFYMEVTGRSRQTQQFYNDPEI